MPEGWRALPPEIGAAEARELCRSLAGSVALTGATGFIGSHLLDALRAAGVAVRLLVRDAARLRGRGPAGEEVRTGDLEDPASLARFTAGASIVFHLAGRLRAPSQGAFDAVNRVGTENLVSALRRHGATARLVLVSSLAAAGPSPDPAGKAPRDTPRPVSAYGRSKLGGETAVSAYEGEWVIIRPPAVYGPRDIDIFQFFKLARRGLVPVPAGERWLTIVHVADVVRSILAAATRCAGEVVHVGEPEAMRLRDLAVGLAAAGGVRARVLGVPAMVFHGAGFAGDVLQRLGFRDVAMTSDKARELLARHWTARTEASMRALERDGYVPFADGARATWAWYREHGWLPRANITAA